MEETNKRKLDRFWAANADWIRQEIGDILNNSIGEAGADTQDVDEMQEMFDYLWEKLRGGN